MCYQKPTTVNGDGDELMDIPSMPDVRRRLVLAGVPRVVWEPGRQVIKVHKPHPSCWRCPNGLTAADSCCHSPWPLFGRLVLVGPGMWGASFHKRTGATGRSWNERPLNCSFDLGN